MSNVMPQKEEVRQSSRTEARRSREGRLNEGKGLGLRALRARKSAIKAAFSKDLGRRNAVKVSGKWTGQGCRKLSLAKAWRRVRVSSVAGREKDGGTNEEMACAKSGGT